jgi:hypothetical protein
LLPLHAGLVSQLYQHLVSAGRVVPRALGGFVRLQQGRMPGYKARARNDLIAQRCVGLTDTPRACVCVCAEQARSSPVTAWRLHTPSPPHHPVPDARTSQHRV